MPLFPPLIQRTPEKPDTFERIVRKDLRSANWDGGGDLSGGADAAATAGYLIDYATGAAQFQNIYAKGGVISGDVTIEGTLTGNDIVSTGWTAGGGGADLSGGKDAGATVGYFLDASAGAAQFQNIYAEGGSLGALTVDDAVTLGTGGIFRTAATGQRIYMSFTNKNRIDFFSGDADEEVGFPSSLQQQTVGTGATRMLWTSLYGTFINPNDEGVVVSVSSASADGTTYRPSFRVQQQSSKPGTGAGLDPVMIIGDPITIQMATLGTAARPAFGIGSNYDDGIYSPSDGLLGIVSGGVEKVRIDGAQNYMFGGLAAYGPAIRTAATAVGTPGYTYNTDATTGFYHIGVAGYHAVACSGAIGMQWGPTSNKFIYGLTTGTTNAMQYNTTTGQITYIASTRRIKKNIRDLPDIGLTDLLRPRSFQMKKTHGAIKDYEGDLSAGSSYNVGLIAEEVADVIPNAGIYLDGDPEAMNYEDRAVLAILVKDLQDTRRRIAALESE
ncbi:tail fiber domain-containing protein [Pseudomonadota bacterium]